MSAEASKTIANSVPSQVMADYNKEGERRFRNIVNNCWSWKEKLLNFVSDQTLETPNSDTEQVEQQSDLTGDSNVSIDSPEVSSDQERTLPILNKIEDLSNKVQTLRKDHKVLCNEVKGMTVESFPGSEVFNALQGLSVEHELLKKKYLEESNARKRLYNEVIELKGNIRVFCRCRPLNEDEIAKGSTSIVDFESCQENELQIIGTDSSRKQFKFDHVFRPEHNQEAVFVQTLPIVTSVLDGYNVCIFAYGQTGTGKTFTMEGTPENRGVNYRTLEELFKISNERSSVTRYELCVSMLEVYNEKIRDLLAENQDQPAKKLEIKQSAEGTQEVPGLVEDRVYGTNEVWELLKRGSRARSVGSTNANELSSRSHCLVRVTVTGVNLINGQRTRSHLWLVDLAGSERVGKIEVEGERLKESQFINKSLSALGDVISALASKTAHISPSADDFGETLCSLNFASRVRGIEHGPARKQTDTTDLFKYKQLAEKAKHDEKETKKLQDALQSLQLRFVAREHICRNLQEKVRDLENQLAEERRTRQKQESRALAAVSAQSSLNNKQQQNNTVIEKRPPLAPSKLRPPLRRITNFLPPPPSPIIPSHNKSRTSFLPLTTTTFNKENQQRASSTAANKSKSLFKPRRCSIAVKSTQTTQPKRRASIATMNPNMTTPLSGSSNRFSYDRHISRQSFGWDPHRMCSNMTTPLKGSTNRFSYDRSISRQSFGWDPQRVQRRSTVASPLPIWKEKSRPLIEATPVGPRRSSKFMGSPPSSQAPGSWKPKHPTVVALQRKQLVWSPLKMRGMKSGRKSFLAS
ncbi:hypothetical protein LguiB_005941 [Lonicera macranthoides]